ncbi:E3 ubiquitin-protein ligase PUB24-like [Andrographis paniculata]|uniref:E3 ubiquitin-protein ligase PUB24-like n=1 Tax=Andrographis paniculata TaxID=175694 RepID=UPI0021E920C9|nr:E3 ubiquitin-protein ligase PUB24-like [Andrographis paniculata]
MEDGNEEEEEIAEPEYFLCPISLQIMKDPVTTVAGITYDRKSIEQWLGTTAADEGGGVCPVTKQAISRGSDLTPNHMLRKLIQAWCIANGKAGIEIDPPPKSPVQRSLILKLIRDVNGRCDDLIKFSALKKLDELAMASERKSGGEDLKVMVEAGVAKAMVAFVSRSFQDGKILAVDLAVRILRRTWTPTAEIVGEDVATFIQAILWILNTGIENQAKILAVIVLKNVTEIANSNLLERFEPYFFTETVLLLRKNISPAATRATLQILIKACESGRNKVKTVEAGAVFDLIEIEIGKPERKTTELIFSLLAILCSCADGRHQLLKHAGGIAVAAKRLLRVSPSADDRILCVLEWIARRSATREVVLEMLRVGGVTKLCMVLQADCAEYLKTKARAILRLHSGAWGNSPCIQVYLLTRDPR